MNSLPGKWCAGAPNSKAPPFGHRGCVDALIRVLVDLHSIDPKGRRTGRFQLKPDGYLERQVRRWGSQWELVRLPGSHRDADISRLHLALQQAIPQQSRTSDRARRLPDRRHDLGYRDPCHVRAVVDPGLSTLGIAGS